jgi:hypothetical protein
MDGAPIHNTTDAAYFVAWVDRLITGAQGNSSWNTDAEKESVLSLLREARARYAKLAE